MKKIIFDLRSTTKKAFLLFFLILFNSLLANNSIAICAMFKNEAPYLKEWIEFHRIIGVDHFYLYNNCSDDNYYEILEPYIATGIITLVDWPYFCSGNWDDVQIKAYNNCLKYVADKYFWLAIIDVDEFIVPVTSNNLCEFLDSYKSYAGVEISWQNYGTSFLDEIPENKTMLEMLIYKAPKNSKRNANCKSICQPRYVKKLGIHTNEYLRNRLKGVTFPFRTNDSDLRSVDVIRIQHYWTRTENYFKEKKIPRLKSNEQYKYTFEKAESKRAESNSEIDTTALRFIPELRKRLNL